MNLRRGFKAEANRWSKELRKELSIPQDKPLNPWLLAEHLCLPIYKLSSFPASQDKTLLMNKQNGHDFSAAVCFEKKTAFIVLNDSNHIKRQASDVAHEIAHVLLRHPADNPFFENGIRDFSLEHEAEAEYLGPALLVSDEAALAAYKAIHYNGCSIEQLSDEWLISKEVIRMRINFSGARRRLNWK